MFKLFLYFPMVLFQGRVIARSAGTKLRALLWLRAGSEGARVCGALGVGGPGVRGTRCRGAWEGPVCEGGPVGRPGYEGTWICVGGLMRGGLGVPI